VQPLQQRLNVSHRAKSIGNEDHVERAFDLRERRLVLDVTDPQVEGGERRAALGDAGPVDVDPQTIGGLQRRQGMSGTASELQDAQAGRD
jgi:hypothetical protein